MLETTGAVAFGVHQYRHLGGQQLLKGVDQAMFRGAAQLIEKRLDPGCGQLGAIGVKMAGEAPEVLAAVIEVQGFGSFGEAIFDQVLYPECPVSRTENFFGASQSQAHRRCPLPPRLAQPPRSRAPFLES